MNSGRSSAFERALSESTGGLTQKEVGDSLVVANAVSEQNKLNPTFPTPTTLIFLGASITDGMVGFKEDRISTYLASQGYTVTVVDAAVGGDQVVDILARWEALKGTYTGDSSVYVFCHAGGNNVSSTRPYSTASQADLDTFNNDYAALVSSIVNNGNTLMPATLTYRAYSGMLNEDEGSKPYNTNIVEPILAGIKEAYTELVTQPINLYDYTKNYCSVIAGSDGVHYNSDGYMHLRKLVADNLVSIARSSLPIQDVGSPAPDESYLTEESLMYFVLNGSVGSGLSNSIFSAAYSDTSNGMTDFRVMGFKQNYPSILTLTTAAGGTGSNAGALDTGDVTLSLTNDKVKDGYKYTSSGNWNHAADIKNLKPNQRCIIQVAGYKDSALTDRITEYTTDGGATFYELDCSNNNANRVLGFMAQADSNGELTLEFRMQSGAAFGYFNGFILTPL